MQGLQKGATETQVREIFAPFGEITSILVQKNDSDDSLANNAFVCFKDPKSATQAIDAVNKQKRVDGTFLFVSPHVAKRQNDLAQDKTKAQITQNMNRNFQSNLFVNHIPTNVTEADIHKLFEEFGEIISIKLKQKNAQLSRFNHAYVLFEKVESCQAAIKKLDKTRIFGNTPLDVEFWISKVDLAAEREQKQKEQMQKDFNSAIYEIRNEFYGNQRNKSFNGQRGKRDYRGNNKGGRGGRPNPSPDRKNSREPRSRSKQNQAAAYKNVPLPP